MYIFIYFTIQRPASVTHGEAHAHMSSEYSLINDFPYFNYLQRNSFAMFQFKSSKVSKKSHNEEKNTFRGRMVSFN